MTPAERGQLLHGSYLFQLVRLRRLFRVLCGRVLQALPGGGGPRARQR